MKVAPLHRAMSAFPGEFDVRLVHTGQHYDANMSDHFFRDLGLPRPDVNLEVGSGTHAEQTGRVMIAYEALCHARPPELSVVVGDVNSTIACTLAAVKLGIKVAHLEAGLRSRDRSMPEEINRIATDALADILWTPSRDANENLFSEGIDQSKVEFVGNIMIDSLEMLRPAIERCAKSAQLGLAPKGYGIVTVHRPSNVDNIEQLARFVDRLLEVSSRIPLVFPVHPRTRARLESAGLAARIANGAQVQVLDPLGYVDFMSLIFDCRLVLTDSGGIQEETTYLRVPCITIRDSTERPVTVTEGTNRLAKLDQIPNLIDEALSGRWPEGRTPELWDGKTAARIVQSLRSAA